MFKFSALYQLHLVKAEIARSYIPKEFRLVEAFGYMSFGSLVFPNTRECALCDDCRDLCWKLLDIRLVAFFWPTIMKALLEFLMRYIFT